MFELSAEVCIVQAPDDSWSPFRYRKPGIHLLTEPSARWVTSAFQSRLKTIKYINKPLILRIVSLDINQYLFLHYLSSYPA